MGKRGNNEGSIYAVPGGWRGSISIRCLDGRTKRKTVQRQTRAEVSRELNKLLRKKETNQPMTSARRTVGQFMNQWLEVHVKPNKAPLTYRGYEQTARMYIYPVLGRIPLERLNGQDVQRCLNKASEDGLSPTSVKAINSTLKTALSTAQRWQYLERNVAKDATPPKQVKYQAHPLTEEQGDRLLAVVAGHRYEAIHYLGLMMGLRKGEVAGVGWSDIDFVKRRMQIRHGLQRIPGKGLVRRGVKTDDSAASIPIPKMCLDVLLRRKMIQEQEFIAAGAKWKQDEDFVFTSRYGARIVIEELTRELNAALDLAKLPHVRFHDLRHSTASLLLAKGVPMKVVQEIMRHANFTITMDTYSHLLPSALEDAARVMNDIFSPPVATPVATPQRKETIQ
jgi:integrase